MLQVRRKWILSLFLGISLLVVAQVTWWSFLFVDNVNHLSNTEIQLLQKESSLSDNIRSAGVEEIQKAAFHKRIMFLSETLFFGIVSCIGLYLLYSAITREEKLKFAERNFIETFTHESKTPLTALKLRLESSLEKNSDNSETQKDLKLSLYEVRRLSTLFEKVLNLNRMERQSFSFEPLCVNEVIHRVFRRLEPLFEEYLVKYEITEEEDLWVKADAFSLENSIQNLLENAIYYNDAQEKRVFVAIKKVQDQVRIYIEDNGSGVDVKDRPFLFEKFYRGRKNRRMPGTGLGLYIAKNIIEAHQGVLRLVDLGTQTVFEIQLPLNRGFV